MLSSKKHCFSPKKGIFVLFSVSPFFLHSLFWPPPFSHFFSVSFFLPSFLFFVLYWFFLVFSLLLFHEKNDIKILNCKVFVHQSFFIFVGFLFLSNPLSLPLFFS